MSDNIRVAIVDDDPLVRAGLRMILGGDAGIALVGEAEDGGQAITMVAETLPDVVLMDIRMPRLDGIQAARHIAASGSHARIIMLTTFDTDDMVMTSLRDGAAGFLLKDTPPPDLVAAVHRVAAGESILSPSVTRQVIRAATAPARNDDARAMMETLTERERDVAIAVARGLSNADIAAELFLGVATVKTHIGRLFTKLEVSNRVQLARRVHDARL
ncbi:response regulator [Microbacterium amylolyticum]|uniref:DNA-binding NarL/FixJ family response regulator n=1 Tax=Microbacterium amylolyticum TaxID=936337 RepID=A0ABS4ZG78_9MICO|nr:response regulator transcription factor [Microbacterium amylolyticum]MBP2436280.1 DNA-binding NarL/FixJ family response regulator [Microbacterium amylolyticum]